MKITTAQSETIIEIAEAYDALMFDDVDADERSAIRRIRSEALKSLTPQIRAAAPFADGVDAAEAWIAEQAIA